MNVYVSLRVIFHSLLFVNNLLALTAAAWSISASGGELHPRASPGAVLVVLGCVAFMILGVITWAEACAPRTLLSRVRTEVALVPMLIIFQLIGAAVATSNAVQSVCHDPTSCIALLVLSWITPFSLIVYYLMVLVVTFDHAKTDSDIWDASPLEHPWFLRPPPPPPKEGVVPLRRFSITAPLSLRTQPSTVDHKRQRSSWMPPSLRTPSPKEHIQNHRLSLHSSPGSAKSSLLPKWARDLRPVQRGLELPFPVQSPLVQTQARRSEDPRRIDAPVSPTAYTEDS